MEDTAVSFYIEDFQAAEALQKVDRTIGLPDGRKMIVIVRNSSPQFLVNEQLKERMKLAMQKRYNPATRALNLEKFHTDPDLSDIFCALFRPQIMLAAFDVIKDNIPDLEALNLNDNKLHMLDHFKQLALKVPKLKVLYMANNKVREVDVVFLWIFKLGFSSLQIPYVTSLDSLKALSLVEINLEGNPLKDRIKDQTVYVRYWLGSGSSGAASATFSSLSLYVSVRPSGAVSLSSPNLEDEDEEEEEKQETRQQVDHSGSRDGVG